MNVHAQVSKRDKPARIATLSDLQPIAREWFLAAMRDQGWTEGRNFVVVQSEFQFGGPKLDEAVARVLASKPDVIFVTGVAYALAMHRATTTIPIVMFVSGYPVEAGLAESLARPGKNVTGNAMYVGTEIWSKLLQLLREAKPDIERVSVLWTYVPPAYPREEIEPCYAELKAAESALGLRVHIVEVASADRVPAALTEIDSAQPDALLLTGGLPVSIRPTIMQFVMRRKLPTISDFPWRAGLEVHPLLSYGPSGRELAQSAAGSIVKILEGARASELPIQRPARFEMSVNLKTANALGITIPPTLLARADEVIE